MPKKEIRDGLCIFESYIWKPEQGKTQKEKGKETAIKCTQ
jgi:hypothetical protein